MKKVVLIIGMMLFALGIVRGQSTGTVENMQQGTTEQVQIEEFVPKVIIEGKWGTGAGEFGIQHGSGIEGDDRDYSPNSIAVDSKGNIYILDMVNNRIQKFNSEGKYLLSIQVDSWKGETRIWHDKIVYNEYLGDNIPSIRPNSAKGINIVIDSDDVLYYYLVREKENKGEVWQFKNDKFVKKWEAPYHGGVYYHAPLGVFLEKDDSVWIFNIREKGKETDKHYEIKERKKYTSKERDKRLEKLKGQGKTKITPSDRLRQYKLEIINDGLKVVKYDKTK